MNNDRLEYNDWFEDGFCLFCGNPAKERYHSDSRESSFSCHCEYRIKFNEVKRHIKTLMDITEYHLNTVTLNKRLKKLKSEIQDNKTEIKEIEKLLNERNEKCQA